MSGVTLTGLRKRYGANAIVRGLDLRVAPGEFFTLLGPSGCGKTTTLRLVAGLEAPDGGTIAIGDEEVVGARGVVPPEARRLGMVFQSYAVWPHRTVRDNVAYPLVLRGLRDAAARADAALAKVRLDGFGDRMPSTLSGGQQQRVALARALAAEPRVLLLDEPLSNLDAGLREELGAQIAELSRAQGLTVLMVTHDPSEALALSDRVGVMNGGVLAQVGTPTELYDAPASAFVARFTGPVNELPLTMGADGPRVAGVPIADAWTPNAAPLVVPADGEPRRAIGFRPEQARWADTGLPARVLGRAYRGASTRWQLAIGDDTVVLDSAGPPKPCIRLCGARVW